MTRNTEEIVTAAIAVVNATIELQELLTPVIRQHNTFKYASVGIADVKEARTTLKEAYARLGKAIAKA